MGKRSRVEEDVVVEDLEDPELEDSSEEALVDELLVNSFFQSPLGEEKSVPNGGINEFEDDEEERVKSVLKRAKKSRKKVLPPCSSPMSNQCVADEYDDELAFLLEGQQLKDEAWGADEMRKTKA